MYNSERRNQWEVVELRKIGAQHDRRRRAAAHTRSSEPESVKYTYEDRSDGRFPVTPSLHRKYKPSPKYIYRVGNF